MRKISLILFLAFITTSSSLDARSRRGVSCIRNQGKCNSGWAFAAVACMEYEYWQKTNNTINLSEQYLIDCVNPNTSCNATVNVGKALLYVLRNGIPLEVDYPNVYKQEACRSSVPKATKFNSYREDTITTIDKRYQDALVWCGVMAVAVDATGWNGYTQGIFISPNVNKTLQANHYVNLVGYGTENGIPYWIARNSWGNERFGRNETIAGYIRLDGRRNANGTVYGGIDFKYNYCVTL